MSLGDDRHQIDVFSILAKTIYLGMFTNVLLPMVLLLLCYYFDQQGYVDNKVGDMANVIFYLFGVLSLGHTAVALWQKGRIVKTAMIVSRESFEQDLKIGLLRAVRKIYIIVAAISLYGCLYFYLTGRFQEAVFMVLFSFLVFQVIRPRDGSIRKLIRAQENFVERGEFRQRLGR